MDLKKIDKGGNALYIDFPAIKFWNISAQQHIHYPYLGSNTPYIRTDLIFEDFDVDIEATFKLNSNTGYLEPSVWGIDINPGKTYIYHDYWLVEIFLN